MWRSIPLGSKGLLVRAGLLGMPSSEFYMKNERNYYYTYTHACCVWFYAKKFQLFPPLVTKLLKCICTHMQTYIHTNTLHIYTYVNIHTCIDMHTHAKNTPFQKVQICPHFSNQHTHTHTHKHISKHASIHTYIGIQMPCIENAVYGLF